MIASDVVPSVLRLPAPGTLREQRARPLHAGRREANLESSPGRPRINPAMPRPPAPIVVALLALGSAPTASAPFPRWAPPPYPAKVIGVADGDTLTVLRDDRSRVRFRLT